MKRIAGHTVPGGGVILVEKVLGSSAQFEELLTRRYYALKAMNGYTADQIQRKRLALFRGRAPAGHGPRERGMICLRRVSTKSNVSGGGATLLGGWL